MSVTRDDYAKRISDKFNLTFAESRRILDYLLIEMKQDLNKGERISFRGFGSFRTMVMKGHILKIKDKIIPVNPYYRCIFRGSKLLYKKSKPRRKK